MNKKIFLAVSLTIMLSGVSQAMQPLQQRHQVLSFFKAREEALNDKLTSLTEGFAAQSKEQLNSIGNQRIAVLQKIMSDALNYKQQSKACDVKLVKVFNHIHDCAKMACEKLALRVRKNVLNEGDNLLADEPTADLLGALNDIGESVGPIEPPIFK